MWDSRNPTYGMMLLLFRVIKLFLFVVVSVAILSGGFWAGLYSYDYYYKWQERKSVQGLVDAYEDAKEKEEERKMADTYGGATPQETLQMFIDAVEEGDYDLASKYFVESKREEWRGKMEKFTTDDKEWFLSKMLANNNGLYVGDDKKNYVVESMVDSENVIKYSTINFILYSNNTWKISNIEPIDF